MNDLVGSMCVICNERITSILDAKRCDSCGNTFHDRCYPQRPPALAERHCSECGATPPAAPFAAKPGDDIRLRYSTPDAYPVSRICPNCGSSDARKVKPKRMVAFALDRICKQCHTRYSPPTPVWAGVVFILAGLLLAGSGAISLLFRLANGSPAALAGMICEGLLALMGVLALIHGIRCLLNPGKV